VLAGFALEQHREYHRRRRRRGEEEEEKEEEEVEERVQLGYCSTCLPLTCPAPERERRCHTVRAVFRGAS